MSSYKSTFLSNSLTRQKLNQINQNSSMKNGLTGKYNMYLGKKTSKNSLKEENNLLPKSYELKSSIKDNSSWLLTLDLINFIQSLCVGKLSSQAKWTVLELYANAKNIKTNFDAKLDKRIIEKYKLAQKRNNKKATASSPSAMELSPKTPLSHSFSNKSNTEADASALAAELSNSINGSNSCVLTRSEELRAKLQAEFFYSHQHTLSNKFVQAAQHFYKSLITRNVVKTGDKNNEIWPSNESKLTKMKSLDSMSNEGTSQTFGINIKSKRNQNTVSLSTSLPANSFMNYYSLSPLNNGMPHSASAISSDLPFKLDEDIITEEKEDEENDDNYIYSSDDDNMDEDQNYGNCMDDQLYNYLQNKNIKTYY